MKKKLTEKEQNYKIENSLYISTLKNELTEWLGNANLASDDALEITNIIMKSTTILKNHPYDIFYLEKENRWCTYVPDENHPRKRRPIRSKSKETVEKKLIHYYLELEKEKDIHSKPLEYWFEKWLIYRRDHTAVKAKTIQENVNDWNLIFKDTDLSRMPLKDINSTCIVRFFREITKDREYTRKRITNAVSVLNGIMYYAIEEGVIENNPVKMVSFRNFTYKPEMNQQDNVYSMEETEKLLTYLEPIMEPYALAIQLSFQLLIRIGETKALKWEDIDYEKRTIFLHQQVLTERALNDDLTFSSRQTYVSDYMKGYTSHGYRKAYLNDEALEILERAKMLNNATSGFIFNPNGHPMTTDSFNRRLKKYCKEANIPYYSSHKIRFYTASAAYNGTNMVQLSQSMGHSNTTTTAHYLRNVKKSVSNAELYNQLGRPSKKK